ncbi:MAG: hypothetical protein AB7H90_05330 [Alphaproteobacteria bacterium]
MADTIATFIILGGALFLGFKGLGMLTGFGADSGEDRGTVKARRVITVAVVGAFALLWLSTPGADQQMAGTFNMAWGNLVRGVQPLVSAAAQIGAVALVVYVIWRIWRR